LELQKEFQLIKKSEAYKTINGIGDWDEYFADTKEKLTEQINELENGKL
jgi:hypothetical protein